jgi:23S rRNA (guanosine2251-2'-O)-methyltransferase
MTEQENRPIVLEGFVSVEAALRAQVRHIEGVFILKQPRMKKSAEEVAALAEEKGITVKQVTNSFFSKHARGKTHGGIIALAGPRKYHDLEELIADRETSQCIVMLDGIEDPFNLGFAVRALYACGVDALVLSPRDWGPGEAIIARSSAGTSELMPMAQAKLAEASNYCRAQQLAVSCTARDGIPISEADLKQNLFLVIGGERRGITRSFREQADLVLSIPYGREFPHSLGTGSAAAILAYEIMRQRRS